jgi:hypothetical protein
MRLNAYVLAADPTWLTSSVLAYYEYVERIVVSYDEEHRGWTGAPVPVEECLDSLRALDRNGKLEFKPGRFGPSNVARNPIQADTHQRLVALSQAAEGADWVIQIDSDEVLPRWEPLREAIEEAERRNIPAVEWPLRVLYRRLRDGRFLQVVTVNGSMHVEYAPVAVRPDARLIECRRTDTEFLRPLVLGDTSSLQVAQNPSEREHRIECVQPEDVIWHNSWARPAPVVRRKIRSWTHNEGAKSWIYYYTRWLPAPLTWKTMRNFNPVHPPLWPRLAPVPSPPLSPQDVLDEPSEHR